MTTIFTSNIQVILPPNSVNPCNYLPVPPRTWSRIENRCIIFDVGDSDINELFLSPISNKYVNKYIYLNDLKILNKNKVLQYKSNSANFTKQQNNSRIYQGYKSNYKKSFATQKQSVYTNPNTNYLIRRNSTIQYYDDNNINIDNNQNPFCPIINVNSRKITPPKLILNNGVLLCNTQQVLC